MDFFHYFMLFIAIFATVQYLFASITVWISMISLKDLFSDRGWIIRFFYLVISIISWLVLHQEGVL